MNEPKPFASLSSSLLARKGQAKPAMRPQGFHLHTDNAQKPQQVQDDLGWNDMGEDVAPPPPTGLTPMETHPAAEPVALYGDPLPEAPEPPPVLEQIGVLKREFAEMPREVEAAPEVLPEPEPEPVLAPEPEPVAVVMPAPVAVPAQRAPIVAGRAAPGSKGKSAFTLRLDGDRHLQLRLICALTHRSAQQVVTQALDEFLARQPGNEALASLKF